MKNKRNILSKPVITITAITVITIFFACNSATQRSTQKRTKKPNILFIFADDLNYQMVHATGNAELTVPNLDKLVEEGVMITHAYNMGSWSPAVCMASRGMLNTGRFLWKAHSVEPKLNQLTRKGDIWAKLMEKAGYETYMTGKWHVKVTADSVFDHVVHVRPGMPNQTPQGYNRPLSPQDTIWEPWDTKYGGYWKGGKHWSEVLGDDAVNFLKGASKSDKPFFMYLAFNASHDPRQSPKKFVDMYPIDRVSVPENFLPEYPYEDQIGCGKKLRDERLMPFPRTKYAVKVNRQEYDAITTHMDVQIGRILDALRETGKLDNTYIFFTADHGLAVGEHGLAGKQNLYDCSLRVPLIVVGPKVPKNKKIDTDVYLQDIMASALDIVGVKKPDFVDFNSFMPIIHGKRGKSYYNAIYGAYLNLQRMIREDGFKLIIYPKVPVVRLYNLNDDPYEMVDLGQDSKYQGKIRSLFADFEKLQVKMEDTLNLKYYFPDLSTR